MHLKEINKNDVFWQQWLKKYKSFRCLWDTLLETPLDERLIAWEELIEMAKTVKKNADAIYIRRHLKKFICQYKLEAKKVEVAEANGFKYKPASFSYKIFESINVARQSGSAHEEVPSAYKELHSSSRMDLSELNQEKQFWSKFIKKYVSLKCLWDRKKTYSKPTRLNAWIKLLKMVKTQQPDANLKYIKKRINGFRTSYRRELTKINKIKEQGNEYTSNLYYFDLLTPIYQSDCESLEYSSDEEEHSEPISASIASAVEDEVRAEFSKKIRRRQDFAECSMDNDLWRKFIKKYVGFKCLWDHKEHKICSKAERLTAWLNLLKFVKSSYPAVDLAYIKNRVRVFRTVFKKEQKKILSAKEKGVELQSTIFYYDLIKPVYEKDGNIDIEYSSDESTNDCKTDLESVETEGGQSEKENDHSKNLALFKKLQNEGFICRPFETENLTHNKKVWLKVIRKYVLFKCLWDSKNRDKYKDYEREAAWVELLEIVKTIIPEADLAFVKHRVQVMRSNYCRTLQKAKEAKQNGFEPEIFLYYFNEISPVYQEGFPISMDDDEDPKREEQVLNPKFTTYFPDDDDDGRDKEEDTSELENKDTIETDTIEDHFQLVSADEACNDVSEISFEQNELLEIFSDQQAEQLIDNELIEVKKPIESITIKSSETCMPTEEHSIATNENPGQSQTTKTQNLNYKRKSIQNNDDDGKKSCKILISGKLSTFESKIAQHLEEMGTQEFLLAEKLITDVCIYGRLGKLTIESGVVLKKN